VTLGSSDSYPLPSRGIVDKFDPLAPSLSQANGLSSKCFSAWSSAGVSWQSTENKDDKLCKVFLARKSFYAMLRTAVGTAVDVNLPCFTEQASKISPGSA
jgi:hypothetical protein